jgi:hypothetical protein
VRQLLTLSDRPRLLTLALVAVLDPMAWCFSLPPAFTRRARAQADHLPGWPESETHARRSHERRATAPCGKRGAARALSEQTLGPRAAVLVLGHEQPVPILQQLARSHPSGRDDVRQIPAVAAQRRGSFGRAWDRHQPRDRSVLVEPVWADIRRRDPKEADRADARPILNGAGIWTRSL